MLSHRSVLSLRCAICVQTKEPHMNAAIVDCVSNQIWGGPGRFDKFCSMGRFDGSLLVAGIIYHNYDKQHGVIEVSAGSASKRWMTKDILRQFLSMPFTLLGCQTIVARHAVDRPALRRMGCPVGGGA